jgi:E3 ubiquitin-protein ligase UBR1
MIMAISIQERQLCEYLRDLPRQHKNRYTEAASRELLCSLFWSLAGGQQKYLKLLFPNGPPSNQTPWKLRDAQGAVDGAEYTEAARGKACGHIFKSGEATYRCKTCSADDTCVLCSRCYDSTEHDGHMVYITISPGNSGCCDCGDPEAWRVPVHCPIHTVKEDGSRDTGKGRDGPSLPDELVESIRMTVGRAFDYICDVISCSPEQLRIAKTADNIREDEKTSRLTSVYYNGDVMEEPVEWALLLWNDEKHTVNEVRDQVARACKVRTAEALQRAHETDDIGRSIVKYDTSLEEMLRVAKIIEQIKVTVTIRSARDTFREQMCGTMIEWLGDIAGCTVGDDGDILRRVVCEEMLQEWRRGSPGSNDKPGKYGLDDHDLDDRLFNLHNRENMFLRQAAMLQAQLLRREETDTDDSDDEDAHETGSEGIDEGDDSVDQIAVEDIEAVIDVIMGGTQPTAGPDGDVDMAGDPAHEATIAGYPPPPPPPPAPSGGPVAANQRLTRERDLTPSDSDTAEPLIPSYVYAKANLEIPKTPGVVIPATKQGKIPRYWLETPDAFVNRESVPLHEDLFRNVRLDWMILYDLRMWKKVRIDLRDLYITTVVTIPQFKRILGLRFAGLYTLLAQLYLIADREPDHSIINISLQMLTTPSITTEIVERGNFLTNLMAILYTFLTTRQVAPPSEIRPNGTLDFLAGSVTNRRMYHFFMDLKYLFSSAHVQEKLRTDYRYMMQFLDLARLLQGVCPNVRAVGEHVEYETDAWISASLITREINRLCRLFSESFKWQRGEDMTSITMALRLAARAVILNSLGTERKRFTQAEIKDFVVFHKISDFEFDVDSEEHSVVAFSPESEPISFHHALHYILSWLIECGKSMSRDEMAQILSFDTENLKEKPRAMGTRQFPVFEYGPEDHLMAAFDYSLRVCAWLAQMKAGMWVRNGMSLRHQANTYRGVTQRDVCHHRDIFLLQTAMVICSPNRVLASMIDRYGLEMWMKGLYEQKSVELEDAQQIDIVEEMIHLLIVLLSDRTSLIAAEDEPNLHSWAMRRDIIHVLCFKPLSFTEICSKLPDKFSEQEECQDILDEMASFKSPEGLSDVGTFELKTQYLEELDPYTAHYNKNQREEAENIYRSRMAKKKGCPEADVVFEPKLRPIPSGVFVDLAKFTRTGLFAQIIYYSLLYPLKAPELTPNVPFTRIETFLQVVLHLVLIAIAEDKMEEDEMSEESLQSFVYIALTRPARSNFMSDAPQAKTIVALLEMMSSREAFKACHPKLALVLKRMRQKRPRSFEMAYSRLGVSVDRVSTASPANSSADEERELRKRKAKERQQRVMAQMQQQQKSFLDNQEDIDWGDDDMNEDMAEAESEETKNQWKYPAGTCILCQEETNDTRPYGTFAMFQESRMFRQTDFSDDGFVREAMATPESLDRSAEAVRPFGLASENTETITKKTFDGVEYVTERSIIGKGFPAPKTRMGPVSVGCGHIMHYHCFQLYYQASERRHQHQIARHHPERLDLNEFVCPLCKALGNAFLPILWRGKDEVYPGVLLPKLAFEDWLEHSVGSTLRRLQKSAEPGSHGAVGDSHFQERFIKYTRQTMIPPLATRISHLQGEAWNVSAANALQTATQTPRTIITGTPGAFPADVPDPDSAAVWEPTDTTLRELIRIYLRVAKTMRVNKLQSRFKYDHEQMEQRDLYATDTLASILGNSISAVEIQQRGVGAESGSTYIDKIPQQSLTHLRVLAETATSYAAVGALKYAGKNRAAAEYSRDFDRQVGQLFPGHPVINSLDTSLQPYTPLLSEDTFVFLTECSLCLANVLEIDILHLVRLCYVAELVKVILLMARNMPALTWFSWLAVHSEDRGYTAFKNLCAMVTNLDMSMTFLRREDGSTGSNHGLAFEQECFNGPDAFRAFVKKYALAFLRKCALLLYVRYGTDFNSHISHNPDDNELDRLTEALRLPSFEAICEQVCTGGVTTGDEESMSTIQSMIRGWMHHQAAWRPAYPGHTSQRTPVPAADISVGHPVIYELIGLPKNYDTLMEETMKRKCPTTGKDVSDAMLCLFCGEIFCAQSICCLKVDPDSRHSNHEIGGAQQHMRR